MPLIRPARVEELKDLSELCLRSKAVWGYDQPFLDACRAEFTLSARDLSVSAVVVAEMDGNAIAVAHLKVDQPEADLLKLFVDPANIGNGAGRTLFQWACEAARQQGAARLFIESDPNAAPFYHRMGASKVGLAPSGSIPGRMLPMLALEL